MLRAGEGIVINYDGTGGEIAVSAPQWFIAQITGSTSPSCVSGYAAGSGGGSGSGAPQAFTNYDCPVAHSWVKLIPAQDGCHYVVENPGLTGTAANNPGYFIGSPNAIIAAGTKVIMRQRGTGASSQFGAIYEFFTAGPANSYFSGCPTSGSGSGSFFDSGSGSFIDSGSGSGSFFGSGSGGGSDGSGGGSDGSGGGSDGSGGGSGSGVGSGSGGVGSGSGSGVSGSGVSGSGGSGSGGGSGDCGGSGSLVIEVVTDVQCVNGSIVVTKTTIAIPGGVICP